MPTAFFTAPSYKKGKLDTGIKLLFWQKSGSPFIRMSRRTSKSSQTTTYKALGRVHKTIQEFSNIEVAYSDVRVVVCPGFTGAIQDAGL